mgnify:FL=1
MDLETRNQLLDTTCRMLLAFFDTEIKINDDKTQETQEIQESLENSDIFFDEKEIQPEDSPINIGEKSINPEKSQNYEYSADQKVIDQFKTLIENKFYSLNNCKTQSLIKYIKRNGESHLAEFFYLFLRLLTNQHKDKIIRAALILRNFFATASLYYLYLMRLF